MLTWPSALPVKLAVAVGESGRPPVGVQLVPVFQLVPTRPVQVHSAAEAEAEYASAADSARAARNIAEDARFADNNLMAARYIVCLPKKLDDARQFYTHC